MRFTPFYLYTKHDTGRKDVLGNIIYQTERSEELLGRLTEWTADDVTVYGREVTSGARKLLSNGITPKEAKNASHVEIDGSKYAIKSVKDLQRWVLFILEGYRL